VLTVKADSPLKTAKDLNGKTLAVPALSDLTTYATKAWVDSHGGDSTSLKLLEFPFSQIPDALAAGRVDAGFVADPVLQEALDAKKVRIFAHAFDAVATQFMVTGWFVTPEYASKNLAELQKFKNVMNDSAKYIVGHPADTVNVLAKFSNVDHGRDRPHAPHRVRAARTEVHSTRDRHLREIQGHPGGVRRQGYYSGRVTLTGSSRLG
jgi:NitT/TauT family transport system substrate-binding protein